MDVVHISEPSAVEFVLILVQDGKLKRYFLVGVYLVANAILMTK
jgi:hypothetical protein